MSSIEDLCEKNLDKEIDLRPFMIEKPYFVHETDKLQKVVDIFRLMHLRHLPVLSEEDNRLIGVITR